MSENANTYRSPCTLPLKTELLRLQQEIGRVSNPSTELITRAVRRLCDLNGTRHSQVRFDCLAKCIPPLYSNSQYGPALNAIHSMLELGKLCRRPEWSRLAENFAGALEGERGNIGQAVIHYHHALELARQIDDPAAIAAVMTNLGILFQYAGLYRDAIPMHLGAVRADSTSSAALIVPSSYGNLAQSYLAMGDVENAQKAITISLRLSVEPETAYEAHRRTIREWTCVDVALERGDLRRAAAHATRCEHYAVKSKGAASAFLAKLARGRLEIHTGRPIFGLQVIEECAAESMRLDEAKQIDAVVALVKANEALHRPEAALSYLNAYMSRLASRRTEQVSALMGSGIAVSLDDFMDLTAWKFRRARLHAEALEHEIAATRHDMLERLATAATLKEDSTGKHGYRVGKLAALMAEQLGWPPDKCGLIVTAARLHDIGKVGIPDRILLGCKELQEAERSFMESHTTLGAELLSKSQFPELKMAEDVARYHHECWDGSGYPHGLRGERIPIAARVVAIADIFDALTHGRPYAQAWSIEHAVQEICRLAGHQLDPNLVPRFIDLIARLRSGYADLDGFLGRAASESGFLQARKNIETILSQGNERLRKDSEHLNTPA